MVAAWLLTPVLYGAVALGWGLLAERATGRRLPSVLLLPVGFATYLVAARLLTSTQPTTGTVCTVVVVLVALAGFVLGWRRLREAVYDRWAIAAILGVFAVFAAPVVLSGTATFAGYGVLGDTAVHFVLTDALFSAHGSPDAFANSAFKSTVAAYKASGYPVGAHAALGAIRPLTGQDVAWIYQPYLAFVMALLAATIFALLRGVIAGRRLRALAAFVAAQPALVYSFTLQGSIKEIVTLWLVPLVVVLAAQLVAARRTPTPREAIPVAVVAAAALDVIGPAAALWLAPVLVVTVVLLVRAGGFQPRELGVTLGAVIAGVVVLGLPTLAPLASSLDAQGAVLTAQGEVGNLARPLPLSQVLGVHLAGDYRLGAAGVAGSLTTILSVIVAIAGLAGLAVAARRRLTAPLLYAGVSLFALAVALPTGSPWADGKALAIASPAVLVLAAVGLGALRGRRQAIAGGALVAVIGAGILASNTLAYLSASLAPRDKFEELSSIGDRMSGRGPTLGTEFEEFAKHFARDAAPVGASEPATAGLELPARPEASIAFGRPVDLDSIAPAAVEQFPTLVIRRSPISSRPPSNYRRTWLGRYYEVWERRGRAPLGHWWRGEGTTARGVADCPTLRGLAAGDRSGALVAATGNVALSLPVARRALPSDWAIRGDDPTLAATVGAGAVTGPIDVRRAGTYRVWLRGSLTRRVSVTVDGRPVGSVANRLAQPAAWNRLETVRLGAGRHRIRVERAGGAPVPGTNGSNRTIGFVTLTPEGRTGGLVRVPAREYRRLCGRTLDWVELVAR